MSEPARMARLARQGLARSRGNSCGIVLALGSVLFLAGCASSPTVAAKNEANPAYLSGKTDEAGSGTVSPTAVGSTGGTILAVPSRDQLKKNSLDALVLRDIEKGSPDSIRAAVARIDEDSRGMTDQNRIALAVASELMKILYPLETVTWPIPSVPETDVYIGAIRSARKGVYDYGAGGSDFLSLVLPSLVLATSTTPGDYYADAELSLGKALAMNGESVLPLRLLSILAAREGKASLADSYDRQAWALDPSCYPAGIGYCRALIRGNDGAAALAIAATLSARYPDAFDITKLCAEAAFATRDWAVADRYVLAVLKVEPDNTSFLLMRARILVERKEYLKASSLLDAFATRNQTDRDYLLLRSRVIREWNKNLVSATAVLDEAQRLYPDDSEVLLASAEICYQSSQTINGLGGRDFVNRVLSRDGNNRTALALLTKDYLDSRDWANSVRSGEQLVGLSSTTESRTLLLRAYLGSGQTARAASLGKSLYDANAPSDEITSLYLQALIAASDTRAATQVIAARMEGASPALKSILYYHESRLTSDPDARLSSLRSSLLADPRNSQALFAMYEWYMAKKDYRKGEYYLKQVIALDPTNAAYGKLLSALNELLAR